jgi:hypothetical protein
LQGLGLDPHMGTGQGLPELAGAVGKAGNQHRKFPAAGRRLEGL